MPFAGTIQQVELVVCDVEHLATLLSCEISAPSAMIVISAFVDATGIMEKGKQRHDDHIGPC